MSKACLLLFLLGVVVFTTTPSLADQLHDNEPPKSKKGKPFPEHRLPTHPGEKPYKGKGKEPPHGEKPPHRHLLSEEIEDIHKPPQNPGFKPPKGKGEKPPHKPPHELEDEHSHKPHHKPPHEHIHGHPHKPPHKPPGPPH
ncbi:hypothetical protein REPUB_Repub20aG0102600 [Reevesia pubescens]